MSRIETGPSPAEKAWSKLALFLRMTRSGHIIRRYFVVNGFDGALTMLGIIMGFYVSDRTDYRTIFNACFGAAVALGMSGLTSAYISESAEMKKQLRDLEQAMLKDLNASAYGRATRLLPLLIATVNGLSPLLISLLIIAPIWAASVSLQLLFDPLACALVLAFSVVFLLGVFLGRVSGTFWLWSGLRTLVIAAATAALIVLFS